MTGHSIDSGARPTPTVKDPVCGMEVDPSTSTLTAVRAGETFHFCSTGCQAKFDAAPDAYAGHDHAVAEYTCPMHPEIRQPGPGSCPICGMALEPVMVTADTGPSPELRRHDPPVLGRRRAVHPGARPGDGRGPVPGAARR